VFDFRLTWLSLLTLTALCWALFSPSALAETGPLKKFGRPSGFSDAPKEATVAFGVNAPYGFVVGDEDELNEVWIMESRVGFEQGMSSVFNWMSKNKLRMTQVECYSEQNQQCEIHATGLGIRYLVAQLAEKKGHENRCFLILRAEGPAKHPN